MWTGHNAQYDGASILYQYYRIIPHSYEFRIGVMDFSNKIFVYLLIFQVRDLPSIVGLY